jgi:hypothetical protein
MYQYCGAILSEPLKMTAGIRLPDEGGEFIE